MAFNWPGKKEGREPGAKPEFPAALEADIAEVAGNKGENPLRSVTREAASRPSAGGDDPLPALTARLETLGQLLDEAKEQVTSYLLHRESQSSGDAATQVLARKVEALAERLEQGSGGGRGTDQKPDALCGKIDQLAAAVSQYFNALPQCFTAVQQQVVAAQQHADAGLQAIIDILRPPQPASGYPVAASAAPAVGGDWQEALLGSELAGNSALNLDKNQLLDGVLSSDPGACGLVGSLLLFRAAAADKMPPLLKDIGEAFYRWQPRASNRPSAFEKALVEWLMRACDQAGMANTIELVNPGERFDSVRHNAPRPGVEITQVLGWIVLRDNGKVYTKAAVAVK
jgi:hypothetical protein